MSPSLSLDTSQTGRCKPCRNTAKTVETFTKEVCNAVQIEPLRAVLASLFRRQGPPTCFVLTSPSHSVDAVIRQWADTS